MDVTDNMNEKMSQITGVPFAQILTVLYIEEIQDFPDHFKRLQRLAHDLDRIVLMHGGNINLESGMSYKVNDYNTLIFESDGEKYAFRSYDNSTRGRLDLSKDKKIIKLQTSKVANPCLEIIGRDDDRLYIDIFPETRLYYVGTNP